MKVGDKVKVMDDTGDTTEGVLCERLSENSPVPRYIVYSFNKGQVWDNPEKESNMLVAPANWIFVLKEDVYNVFKKEEVGPYEYGVEKK